MEFDVLLLKETFLNNLLFCFFVIALIVFVFYHHDHGTARIVIIIISRNDCDAAVTLFIIIIKNGKDEHFFIAMTNEYLPPQQSWDLAPEGKGKYPAPGLKFHTKQTKFVSKVSHMHISTKSSYMRTKR